MRMLNLLCMVCFVAAASAAPPLIVQDTAGALSQTEAPVTIGCKLTKRQASRAGESRLALMEVGAGSSRRHLLPAQLEPGESQEEARLVFLMTRGPGGQRQFQLRETRTAFPSVMQARPESPDGQVELFEMGDPLSSSGDSLRTSPVLRYNYRTIEPGDVLDKVSEGNRIYARARSDYIHPLFGLKGEILTRDWSVDHPHHRGIYWAWPEVDYGKERGDLHALQKVFARPTGRVKLVSGPVFAQVEAENHWLWEDREPIVREWTIIRAYRATTQGRLVDLAFQFVALKEGVSIARRDTDKYGGLNVRMATPESQRISVHTDPSGAYPRRAWSDLSGVFGGGMSSGLTVLQHPRNPDYPGDWIQYPELSWCQPTFPAARTRYILTPGKPLVLRFRLWLHSGMQPSDQIGAQLWDALQASVAALPPVEQK